MYTVYIYIYNIYIYISVLEKGHTTDRTLTISYSISISVSRGLDDSIRVDQQDRLKNMDRGERVQSSGNSG